jgi:toxin ParE1/3/4
MKRWKIIYSEGARNDIIGIADYIAGDSAINAGKALDRLEQSMHSLTTLPERGRVVPELRWHGIFSVREVFEKPWRILYQLKANTVVIVAVYDGRRQVNDVLLERFLR